MGNEQKNMLSLLTIFLLKICGQNLYEDSIWTKLCTVLTGVTITTILTLGFIQLFTKEISINSLLETFELSGPYIQTLTKIVVLKLSIKILRKVLNEMDERFWPLDKFGVELKTELHKIIRLCMWWPVMLLIGFGLTVIFLLMKTFFAETRITPFKVYEIWDYENTLYYAFVLLFQGYNMYIGPFIVVGYDCLFGDLIVRIMCQMKMLKKGFETLKLDEITTVEEENECYEKIKEYVNHHSLLLRMLNDVKNIYSFILLYKIIAIITSLCIGLFSILTARRNLMLIGRSTSLTSAFLFQLTAYCLAGSVIEYECSQIATSAFYSGWHGNCGKRLKHALYMIIIRAQKPQILSAEGIITTNLQGYGSILQFTISLYTLMSKRATF